MPKHFLFQLVILGAALTVSGCSFLAPRAGREAVPSLLHPAAASDDSVTFEIYFARLAISDEQVSHELWDSVDEQQLNSETRRQLARNGMRAGVVGTQIPAALAQLMQLSDRAQTEEEKKQGVPLDVEPRVNKRLLQLRFGKRGEIVASPVVDELSLLMANQGVLAGKTFREAQTVFATEVRRDDGHNVLLSLLPEVRHGQPQQQWTGQDGILRLDLSRDREVFEQLRIQTPIAPGQLLLVGCLPAASGSLGHHFFTEDCSEGRIQKLLIVRALQVPAEPVFTGP